MISSFSLKFGRTPAADPVTVPATPVTVFVGPNNSGKSKVLSEIERYCRTGQRDANDKLLADLVFFGLPTAHAQAAISSIQQQANPGEAQNADYIFVGSKHGRMQVPAGQLLQAVENPAQNLHAFCQWFLNHNTLILDGPSRIGLVKDQNAGDLQAAASTSFQVLFRDDARRHEVRRIAHEAFGTHFVVDPTNLGKLRIRLSERAPRDDMEERGIHEDAVRFHSSAQPISAASDGVKAFTGIITEVLAGDPRIVLIDEPEAFLHPALASKLGMELSKAALSADKRVFVSTHSPAFVMGCIQSGAPVNIVRLTYRGGVATARLLPSQDILQLMRHPLLRSTGVLSGLFYEFVVVAESDSDRAFYQEINERLLQFRPEWGIQNCLFINAQNKQTIQTIIRPLRQLGIPAAAIVDIDVLKEGGAVWTALMDASSVPTITHGPLSTHRAAVLAAFEATGRNMKREGGVEILSYEHREAANNLFSQMAEYGIFTVRTGELESWLKGVGATGHGPGWLVQMFERMGSDPDGQGYVRPAADDVWEFLHSVKQWLVNGARKGIPA